MTQVAAKDGAGDWAAIWVPERTNRMRYRRGHGLPKNLKNVLHLNS